MTFDLDFITDILSPKIVLDCSIPFYMLFLVIVDDLILNFFPRIMLIELFNWYNFMCQFIPHLPIKSIINKYSYLIIAMECISAEACNRHRKDWEKHFAVYQDISTGISISTKQHYPII